MYARECELKFGHWPVLATMLTNLTPLALFRHRQTQGFRRICWGWRALAVDARRQRGAVVVEAEAAEASEETEEEEPEDPTSEDRGCANT